MRIVPAIVVTAVTLLAAVSAEAQTVGTFRWQCSRMAPSSTSR